MMRISINRHFHFNAAHRLNNPDLSIEENKELYGKCNNPNFHGHNYELIIGLQGEIDEKSGFVFSINELKKIVETEVLDYLDHKNLNLDIDEFKDTIPTVENISNFIFQILRSKISKSLKLNITLYETPRIFAEIREN